LQPMRQNHEGRRAFPEQRSQTSPPPALPAVLRHPPEREVCDDHGHQRLPSRGAHRQWRPLFRRRPPLWHDQLRLPPLRCQWRSPCTRGRRVGAGAPASCPGRISRLTAAERAPAGQAGRAARIVPARPEPVTVRGMRRVQRQQGSSAPAVWRRSGRDPPPRDACGVW
jgi:hypothetical protein